MGPQRSFTPIPGASKDACFRTSDAWNLYIYPKKLVIGSLCFQNMVNGT